MHQNDPEKRYVLAPLRCGVSDFYRDLWVDFLMRLPDEVVAADPIRVAMGEKAAALADCPYSTTFQK
ncbi:MAG: hypothetical protein QOD10_6000 [Mycobacterium sp.]|nr:hypothetical protein [Mycobacterium sp.]